MKLEIPGLDDSRRFKTMVHEYANGQSYRYEAMQAFEAKDEKSEKTYLNYLIANIISSMSYRRVGKNIASLKELQALPPYFGYHIKKKEQDRFGRLLSLVAPIMNDEEVAVHVPEDVYNTAYIIQGIAEMIKYTELVNSSVDMINYGIERIAEGNNWQEVFEELIVANSEPDGLAKLTKSKSKGDNMAKSKNEVKAVKATSKFPLGEVLTAKPSSINIGGKAITVASIKKLMEEWVWEDPISEEVDFYVPLTEMFTKISPVFVSIEPKDSIGIFRKHLGLILYNENDVPGKTSLQSYEDVGLINVPSSITAEEREVLDLFIERTSGVETEDNILGNVIRTLGACYTMSDLSIDPITWHLAALSITSEAKLREHLDLIFAKEIALVENNIKDCSLSSTCEESAVEKVEALKEAATKELKTIKELEGENMKTVVEEKVTTTTVTEGNEEKTSNKSGDSVFTLENALYTVGGVAIAGAVGYGAYIAYNKFFGGDSDSDIELSEFSAF
jgi:hypothetical protein